MIFLIINLTNYHYYLIRLIIQLLNFLILFFHIREESLEFKNLKSLKISIDYLVKYKSSQLISVRHYDYKICYDTIHFELWNLLESSCHRTILDVHNL